MQKDILCFEPGVHQPELFQAWKLFTQTGQITNVVPLKIAASWKRSRQKGVNPFDFSESCYLENDEYQRRITQNQALIDIARPIMESIYTSLEKTRYLVVLYEPEGTHLLRIGKRKDFKRSQRFKIVEGLCFEEHFVGTSGFSLAKHLKKAVQISGCEHYSMLLHYVTGSYAPILREGNGDLIGVLGVTGANTMPNEHTQGIVIAASTAIENLLRLERSRNKQFVLRKSLKFAMNSLEDGVIILNKDLQIVEMNSVAKKLLSTQKYGKYLSQLEQFEEIHQAAVHCLESSQQTYKEMDCKINEQIFHTTIKSLMDDGDVVCGIVVQLKNVQKIARIYQNIAGDIPRYFLNTIAASSHKMLEVKQAIEVSSKTDACVIIEGESGSGKEVVAQCIHNESDRKDKPFVVINCAAIPQELLESTLFGHEKGAFTGAETTHLGKFEIAHHGTLFLDEIGEMSPSMQAKMLRAIENQKIERVGGKKPFPVDVRIIAATNKDLYQLIRQNQFRADLFYRLNVFRICLPPLRDRKEDIYSLVKIFVHEFSLIFKIDIPRISKKYISVLEDFEWPGNVRELKNAVQYSLARINTDETLTPKHLEGFSCSPEVSRDLNFLDVSDHNMDTIEKQVIAKTLEGCMGNKTSAAKLLGISRATIHRKIKRLNIGS